MNSKIVIVVPTKNRRALLERAVQSVFSQSCVDWRMVIVNDGSRDGTQAYLGTIADPRVTVVHHETSRGVNVSRNEAFKKLIVGEWAVPLDDDDYFLPGAFDIIAHTIARMPSVVSVVGFGTQFKTTEGTFDGGYQFAENETEHDLTYAQAMGIGLEVRGELRAAFKWTLFPAYLFSEEVNGFEGAWWMRVARDGVCIRYVKTPPIIFIDWQHAGEHLSAVAARRDPRAFLRANTRLLHDHAFFLRAHPRIAFERTLITFKLAVRAHDMHAALRLIPRMVTSAARSVILAE